MAEPSFAVEAPVGAAIIHTDALLEALRKKQIRDIPGAPKWLVKLTATDHKKLQQSFRQTYADMRLAAKGTDEDMSFAYAHYGLDALRTACGFFSQFVFDKTIVLKEEPVIKKKKGRTPKSNVQTEFRFADLFPKAPDKKPVKKVAKKAIKKKKIR
jgi:hypothetical protein